MHNVVPGLGLEAQHEAADGETRRSRSERVEEGMRRVSHE